jgi:hypothetical protein
MMRPTLRLLAIAGHLAAIQLLAGTLVWWLSPWPWLSLTITIAWLAVVIVDLRHHRFAGALSWWQRTMALLVAQSPALVFGAWNVLYFCGLAPRFELGAFVIQLWLTPLMPLLAFCPEGVVLGRDLWLWALSLAPFVLITGLVLASHRRQPFGDA